MTELSRNLCLLSLLLSGCSPSTACEGFGTPQRASSERSDGVATHLVCDRNREPTVENGIVLCRCLKEIKPCQL